MSIVLQPPPPVTPPAGDPTPLLAALGRLRRQARWWIWVESVGLVCLWAAAVFWATLFVDWLLEPPWQVRAAIMVAAGLGLGWLVIAKLAARLAAPLDDAQLALLVERSHPQFRDSLSTAVELARMPHDDVHAGLLARTTARAVAMLDEVRPAAIFRRASLTALAAAAALAVASVGGLFIDQPEAGRRWASRMVLLGDEPWPRRVLLEAEGFVDGVRKVARGTDVEVLVRAVAGHEIPQIVDLRSRAAEGQGRGWRSERMGTRGGLTDDGQLFGHVLKNVGESLELEIRGGDARLRPLRLSVVEAPALDALSIETTLPDYLGGGTRRAATSRMVPVPRGSDVDILCTATKPLSAAELAIVADGVETTLAALGAPAVGAPEPPRTIAARLDDVDGDRTIIVRFTDTDGLVNREPITFVISAVPDAPPQVALALHGISTAVTPKARIPLRGTITDDHGVAEAAVRLRIKAAGTDAPAAEGDAQREQMIPISRVRPGAAAVEIPADAAEVVLLEPLGMATGTRLDVAVTAADGCTLPGGPNQASSDVWSLDVVTPDALQAMLEAREVILRRRFESVIADFSQPRDQVAGSGGASSGDDLAAAVARLGEAASRAAGETGEIAAAFRDIRLELDNNALLMPEVETRLIVQIADPLAAIAARELPGVIAACRKVSSPVAPAVQAGIVRQADEVLAKMRNVLDMMMELESFNEVIERLRGVIRTQEQIRSDTLDEQKRRAREALEGP